jgi:tryptophan-rich sensory protein
LSVAACLSAGVIGSFFTAKTVNAWYLNVQKPPITPPGWVFAPVWTTLYVMMGISFFLLWRLNQGNLRYKNALTLFILQLLLNVLWSIVFFGFQSIAGGLAVIVTLWAAILGTIIRFYPFSKTAALLLIPYIVWVSYALVLNGWIFILNR